MFELLYIFRITELSFVVCNDSVVDSGNRHLNILNGTKLPSVLESVLYITLFHLWLVLDSNLVKYHRTADPLEMFGFATFSVFLPVYRSLLGSVSCPTVLAFIPVHGLTFICFWYFARWHQIL